MAKDKNLGLEVFIDVDAKPGTINNKPLMEAIVNALNSLNVPVKELDFSKSIKIDKKKTAAVIAKQLSDVVNAEAKDFDRIIEQQFPMTGTKKGDAAAKQAREQAKEAFMRSQATLQRVLAMVTQGQLDTYFKDVDQGLLAESRKHLAKGRGISEAAKQNIARYAAGMAELEKQFGQIAAAMGSVGSLGGTFAAGSRGVGGTADAAALQKQIAAIEKMQAALDKIAATEARIRAARQKAKRGGLSGLSDVESADLLGGYGDLYRGYRAVGDNKAAAAIKAEEKEILRIEVERVRQNRELTALQKKQLENAERLKFAQGRALPLLQRAETVGIAGLSPDERKDLDRYLKETANRLTLGTTDVNRIDEANKLLARYEAILKANQLIEKSIRDQAALERRRQQELAREQAKANKDAAALAAAEARTLPLMQQAYSGGLRSLRPEQRADLATARADYESRLVKAGRLDEAARLKALYEAIVAAQKKMTTEEERQERNLRRQNQLRDIMLARLQRIAQLEQAIAAGNAQPGDTAALARQYNAVSRAYDRQGDYANAEQYQRQAAALKAPAQSITGAVRQAEAALGYQILNQVGGMSGVDRVRPDNAQFVRSALEDSKRQVGAQLLGASTPADKEALRRQISDIDHAMQRLEESTTRTNGTIAQFFRYAIGYGALWQALAAIRGLVTGVTDLEKALVSMKAVSGATDAQMVSVAAAIRSVGENSRYSLTEVTEAAKILAQAGVGADKMGEALKNVTNLAAAIEAPMTVVADLMTSMKEIFSTESDANLANQLAAAVNISKLTAEGLQTIIGLSANVAESMQLSSDQYLAAVATLKNAGLKDSTVATGLRQLMLELNAPDEKLIKAFQERYAALGENMTKSGVRDKLFDMFQTPGGLAKALTELERLGYNGEGRQTFARALDIRSQNALEALIRDKSQLIQNQTSIGFSQAAVIGSQQQMQTLNAAVTQLKNSFVLLGDSIGRDALPPMIEMLNTISKAIQAVTDLNERMRASTGEGLGSVVGMGLAGGLAGFAMSTGNNLKSRLLSAGRGAAVGTAAGSIDVLGEQSGGYMETVAQGASYALLAAEVAGLAKAWGARRVQGTTSAPTPSSGGGSSLPAGLSSLAMLVSTVMDIVRQPWLTKIAGLVARIPFGIWAAGFAALFVAIDWLTGAADKAKELKTRAESSGRLAMQKSQDYGDLQRRMNEFNISDPNKAVGIGEQVVQVSQIRNDALARVGAIAGTGQAAETLKLLDELYKAGGTSRAGNAVLVAQIKKIGDMRTLTDAQLTELSELAAEAQAGPQAIADKLEQMYVQLKELPNLDAAQQTFVDAFERLELSRTGFSQDATRQLEQVTQFFNEASRVSPAAQEEMRAKKEEAEQVINLQVETIYQKLEAGEGLLIDGAIQNLTAAIHAYGESAVSRLNKVADGIVERRKEMEEDLDSWFISLAERGRLTRAIQESKDQEDKVRAAAAAEKQKADISNKEAIDEIVRLRDEVLSAQTRLGSRAGAFSQNPGVIAAQTLASTPEILNKSILTMPATEQVRILGKAGISVDFGAGEGKFVADRMVGILKAAVRVMGQEAQRVEEETRKRNAANAEVAAREREKAYKDEIAREQARISKAGNIGTLKEILGVNDNAFSNLQTALDKETNARLENVLGKKAVAGRDLRDEATRKEYIRKGKEAADIVAQYEAETQKINENRRAKQRELELKLLKEYEKETAQQVKLEQGRLDALIASGGSIDEVTEAIRRQQEAHEAAAGAIGLHVAVQQEDEKAGREAADAYREQNIGLAKQVELLQAAAQAAEQRAQADLARSVYESVDMTSGELAYHNAAGYSLSVDQVRSQRASALAIETGNYEYNSQLRAEMAQRVEQANYNASVARSELAKAGDSATAEMVDNYNKLNAEYVAAETSLRAQDELLRSIDERVGTIRGEEYRDTMTGSLSYGLNVADAANTQTVGAWREMGDQLRDGVVGSIDAISEAFVRAKLNGESFKDVFKSLLASIAQDLAVFFMKKAVWMFISSFMGGFGGGPSPVGDFSGGGSAAFTAAGGGTVRMAPGGRVVGPGTGTSDSVPGAIVDERGRPVRPLLLSNGESVLTARATQMLGTDFITAANRGHVRRQAAQASAARLPAAVTNIASGNQTTNNLEVHVPVNVDGGRGGTDGVDQKLADQLASKLKAQVRQTVTEEMRPGGLLYRR